MDKELLLKVANSEGVKSVVKYHEEMGEVRRVVLFNGRAIEQLEAGNSVERMIRGAVHVAAQEAAPGRGKKVAVLAAAEEMGRNNGGGGEKEGDRDSELLSVLFPAILSHNFSKLFSTFYAR